MDVFDRAWKILEARSACDAKGGCEYTRIRKEWNSTIGVLIVMQFIYERANMSSGNHAHDATPLPEVPPDMGPERVDESLPWVLPDVLDELPPIPDLPSPDAKK